MISVSILCLRSGGAARQCVPGFIDNRAAAMIRFPLAIVGAGRMGKQARPSPTAAKPPRPGDPAVGPLMIHRRATPPPSPRPAADAASPPPDGEPPFHPASGYRRSAP